jgi:tetratricopeptide (TPR) repeat protein
MEHLGTTIAVDLLRSVICDAIKSVKGNEASPLTEAIESTQRYFQTIEGLDETIRQWLRDPRVAKVFSDYIEGQTGRDEIPVADLVSILVENTQFYLGDGSLTAAGQIIETFCGKLRTAYLTKSPVAPLHIANRMENGFADMGDQLREINELVRTAGGLKSTLQAQFDEAIAKMEAGDLQAATTLFEVLLIAIEHAQVRDRSLERRVHINLGNLARRFQEEDKAVRHYRVAAELDDDSKRATLNAANADLVEQKPQEALDRLNSLRDMETSPMAFEYSATRVLAFLGLKRFDEAIELARHIAALTKEGRRFELLGHAYREAGRLDEAERAYRDALVSEPSKAELQHTLADVLLAPAFEYHNQHAGVDLPLSMRTRIEEAGNLLECAAALYRTEGRQRAAFQVDSVLAVVRALQNRFSDAITVLEPVVQSGHAAAHDWRTLGFAYTNLRQLDKAANAFKNALAKQSDPETEFLYAGALLMSGKPSEALAFASELATVPVSESNIRWHMLKANALRAKREFSQAREAISVAQEQFPNDADVLLTRAELYDDIGQYADASEAFEKALKNATGVLEQRVRFAFGGFAARRKDFKRATELWKPLIRRDRPDELLDNYVRVAYNSHQFADITSTAKSIKDSSARASDVFAEVAAASYESLDDLVEAGYWLEYLGDHYGNRPKHIARLSIVKLRLGKHEQAIELLNAARATLTDPQDMMRFAQAYSLLSRHRDAIQLAHAATRESNDADMQMAYVALFLAAPESEERTPEEVAQFQEILLKFNERFPKSSRLQSFQIDPEHPLDALRETLKKASEHSANVIAFYQSKRIPLRVFAKLLGKDLYQVWLNVISDPELTLLSSEGTEREQQEFENTLAIGNGFLVEPIALFTFAHLGLLEKLTRIRNIYIVQSSLDELQELQARRKVGTDRETGVIGMNGGEFFMQRITPEDACRINAALNAATEWAQRHGKPLGLTAPLDDDDKKWANVIGSAGIAIMVAAKQHGFALLTDDKTFGDIAKQNYGVPFVNTQAVLLRLVTMGAISQNEYDAAVLKLFEAGYTLTRINEGHLFNIVSLEQFQLTERVKRAFRVFEPATIALIPACATVAGLLNQIYLEPIPDEMKEKLCFHVLDVLALNHPKVEVKKFVRALARQRISPFLILHFAKIEQTLNRW